MNEIEAVQQTTKELNIEGKIDGILKRLLIFAVSSFSPMIEEIFGRPFAFQFSSIDAEQFKNGEWEIVAIISAREQ